jgi:uncharacterized membrane protein YjdF
MDMTPTPSKPSAGARGIIGPLAFTACYLLLAIVGAVTAGNREFVIYICVMLVVIGALAVLHRRVRLTTTSLWLLSVWGLLHMAGGLVKIPATWPHHGSIAVLYNLWLVPEWLKYDQFVHAYGFGVTTWVCWEVLRKSVLSNGGGRLEPTFGLLTLCAAAGIGFGAFNEVIEFLATRVLPNTNVGDYENTGWDLVFNLAGAVAAALIIRRQG